MAGCKHTAWVRLSGIHPNCSVVDPQRLHHLVQSLPEPERQTPSLLLFVGQKIKDQALRYLFPHNNLKRTRQDGLARIRVDNSTATSSYPLFFADADLSSSVLEPHRPVTCHDEKSEPIQWQCSDTKTVADHVLARVLIASSNILVIFADDFGDLDYLTDDIVRWINIGVCSIAPPESRPRLLIVIKGNTWESQTKIRELYRDLEALAQKQLSSLFSLVSTLYLDDALSELAMYRPLKEEILRQTDEIRSTLLDQRWLFSASHTAAAFSMRLHFAATKVTANFSLLDGCRKYHEIPVNYPNHLSNVIAFGIEKVIRHESTASYIASSILMDAYPPGGHLFDPDFVFRTKYFAPCRQAFLKHYPSSFTEFLTNEVLKQLKYHFQFLEAGKSTSAELHVTNIRAKSRLWARMRSNATCVFCLLRTPQHVLPCGHSMCDNCTSTFGSLSIGEEYCFRVDVCSLCDSSSKLCAKMKPPTSGVRILSVDGGGTRAVVPLESLRLLQELLGTDCHVNEFFDIAAGTSSGGLIAMTMFLRNWTPERCTDAFQTMARQLFKNTETKGLLSKLQKGLKCWISDGQYNDNTIDAVLKKFFGESQTMFGSLCSPSGMKVAVTATSISDASCFLLTNYNSALPRKKYCGYSVLPHTSPEQEIPIWQAARATTAAPLFFRTAQIPAHGAFQDGGLRFNNPINLATSECRYIWPDSNAPDVVLSLGTGTTEVESPKAPHFRHVFSDGFVPRLWRAFMSSLDGQNTWRELENRIEEGSSKHYFRLNVSLHETPAIDDVACMERMRNSVHFEPDAAGERTELALALLTGSFFFELDTIPRFEAGLFRCEGSIYCRNNIYAVIATLTNMNGARLNFTNDNGFLADFGGISAICLQCKRYRKKVVFYVTELIESFTTIYLGGGEWPRRRISGFPQTLQWFIRRQRLDAAFGAPTIISRPECRDCSHGLTKRKETGPLLKAQSKKRCTNGIVAGVETGLGSFL